MASALACYPRLSLWLTRSYPLWCLEMAIFLCGIILWAFVFAWHTPYTNRPVFTLKVGPKLFIAVTLAALAVAMILHLFIDPPFRLKAPEDYPADLKQWCAGVLFSLAFMQLFLVFAPFAWLIRLFKDRWIAISLTVLLGAAVSVLKMVSSGMSISFPLFSLFLFIRISMGLLSVLFYLRGGALLTWWLCLLLESRHLPDLNY